LVHHWETGAQVKVTMTDRGPSVDLRPHLEIHREETWVLPCATK